MADIRNLAPDESVLIGRIIGESFSDDPVNQWVFGGARGLPSFYAAQARKLYLKKGFGHVTLDEAAGALWLPPNVSKEIPLWNSLDIAASMVRHGGLGALARGLKVDASLAAHKPKTPHYYLFAIGTIPAQQGKGKGGVLMETALQSVDAAQAPAYLESSKLSNVPFYRRYGFEVIEELVPAPNAPSLWLMWREPRKIVSA